MLQQLAENIRECLAHAAKARERADSEADPQWKADLLDLERRWLFLADSYQFVEQLERFLLEGRRYL